MHVLADRELFGVILDRGDRHAVEQFVVVGKIVGIEVPVLRRDRHDLFAAHRLKQDGRVGDVIVMPVLRARP